MKASSLQPKKEGVCTNLEIQGCPAMSLKAITSTKCKDMTCKVQRLLLVLPSVCQPLPLSVSLMIWVCESCLRILQFLQSEHLKKPNKHQSKQKRTILSAWEIFMFTGNKSVVTQEVLWGQSSAMFEQAITSAKIMGANIFGHEAAQQSCLHLQHQILPYTPLEQGSRMERGWSLRNHSPSDTHTPCLQWYCFK